MTSEILQNAALLAMDLRNQQVTPFHVAKVVLDTNDSLFEKCSAGIDVQSFRNEILKNIEKIPKVEGTGDIYFSSEMSLLLQQMEKRKNDLRDKFIIFSI